MDHTYIEQHHIVDRYVMAKLPVDEAADFEEHYLGCPVCLAELERAKVMTAAFRRAAGEGAARMAAGYRPAPAAALALAGLGRARRWGAAAALLAVALLPATVVFQQQKAARRILATELDAARRPRAMTPILYLDAERGAGSAAPVLRVPLSATAGGLVLVLELEPRAAATYDVALERRADRGELWRGSGLRPGADGTVTVSLPPAFLAAGDYDLAVGGHAASGAAVAVGRFAFRVLASASD